MIDPGFDGAVAIVTGMNNPRGIGAAVARALARQGVAVFGTFLRAPPPAGAAGAGTGAEPAPGEALYRRLAAADAAPMVAAIRAAGGRAAALEVDLADPAAAPRVFAAAEAAFGPVTILVNNAAYSEPDSLLPADMNADTPSAGGLPIGPFTVDTHDRHFHVNVRAPALLMREFARRHRDRRASGSAGRAARIINISTDGADAFPTEVSYGASKHALESLTRSAAHEFGPLGITVNALSPGPIQTGYIPPGAEARIVGDTPLGRVGLPEDVADAVLLLASEQARWLTGQLLYVGGGHAMPR